MRQTDDDDEVLVTAMGYGQTSFAGKTSKILEEAQLKTMNLERCNNIYSDEGENELLSSQICAYDPEGIGRDTWYLVKIVSISLILMFFLVSVTRADRFRSKILLKALSFLIMKSLV